MTKLDAKFWDRLESKYPKGVAYFYKWLTRYKKKNNWDALFNGNKDTCVRAWDGNGYDKTGPTVSPDFKNLPQAMQIGIWIEFSKNQGGVHEWEIEDLLRYDWLDDITTFFKMNELVKSW